MVVLTIACRNAPDSVTNGPSARAGRPEFVATIQPVAMILHEIAGERATITCLLRPGESPHTFSPQPSHAAACARAAGVVMVDEDLDGWAARLAPKKTIKLMPMLPPEAAIQFEHAHRHGQDIHAHDEHDAVADPHFWTDPLTVKTILSKLAMALAETDSDPLAAADYRAGADRFAAQLDQLHDRLQIQLAPARGQALIMFHPSFNYLFQRYGIRSAGAIEPIPGKMPSPGELMRLTNDARDAGARAIATEPQLARRPAELLAEQTGLDLILLDPNGGEPDRATYRELIEFNARALAEALQ